MFEIDFILKTRKFDIILTNERKLDEKNPASFYKNILRRDYYFLRRDLGGSSKSGGILMFIPKEIKIVKAENSIDFEKISTTLLFDSNICKMILKTALEITLESEKATSSL